MVHSYLFVALAILLGVLQVCTCNPIVPGEEQDVTKMFTADELQRARSVGLRDRELINGKSRGVSVDEMVKLSVLQKSEVSRVVDANDTTPLTITFEETPKLCEIFVPEHKTAEKHTNAQGDRLNELFGAIDDLPRNIQFLFLRNSMCAYASEPSKLDKSADTFNSKFLPFMRFRFWILKSKNSTSVERVSAVKQVCCAYNGQYNKDVTEMKVASTTFSLSNEQMTNYDKLWNEFETANTSHSFALTYASSVALHSERTTMMIDEIVHAIVAQGIQISQFHGEGAPGQFEFVTDPYDPLTAADNLIRTRETIYNIATKYDVKATMAPKVFADYAGSGCHCHISLKSSKENVDNSLGPNAPDGMNALEESFLSGILKHLHSLTAFTLPNVTSYNRTKENCWSGSYICWGIDNREATLRLAYTPAVKRKFRFEVRSVDGTSNPYLAVSAIIVAGLDGVRKSLRLDQKEMIGAPSELEPKEKFKLKQVPTSIEESLSNLEEPAEYELFCNGIGKTLVDIFVAVRKGETEHMRKLSEEQQLKFVIKTF